MPETPVGYLPDARAQWSMRRSRRHKSEVIEYRSGHEFRRANFDPAGYEWWQGKTDVLTPTAQLAMDGFLNARRGQYDAFYFFRPSPINYEDGATGLTLSAQSQVILPFKLYDGNNQFLLGSLKDVRVAGVTKAFTMRHLLPRPSTYASLRIPAATTYVDVTTNAAFRQAGDQTVAAWVYIASSAVNHQVFLNQTVNASGMSLYVVITSRVLRFRTNQAGASTFADSTGVVPLNTWTHVAAVRSGTNVTFYINGVVAGTGTGIANPVTATVSATIGHGFGSDNGFADEMIGDVRFYNSAVSAGEIANIVANNASPSANLLGWWRLNEGVGTVATDLSGSGINGTITSPVWCAGEVEATFSGGVQTGPVTVWGYMRPRLIARNASDDVSNDFLADVADAWPQYDLQIKEVK